MDKQADQYQAGTLTESVSLLSVGFRRKAGEIINRSEVPASVWVAWVKDGIVAVRDYDKNIEPGKEASISIARRRGNRKQRSGSVIPK